MFRLISISFADVFRPELRVWLFRSVAIAIAGLFLVWYGLQWLAGFSIALPYDWLDTGLTLLASVGLLLIALYLVPAVTALVAGLFLDNIAEEVERLHYGEEAVGQSMEFTQGLVTAIQFTFVVLVMNLLALLLLLVPGINAIAFLVVNGYLFGREYFELAVLRQTDKKTAKGLRQRHGFENFLLGLVIAGYLAIPILNLTAPLFATSLMVHKVARMKARGAIS